MPYRLQAGCTAPNLPFLDLRTRILFWHTSFLRAESGMCYLVHLFLRCFFHVCLTFKYLNVLSSPSTSNRYKTFLAKAQNRFSPHNCSNKSFLLACSCFDNHRPVKGSLLCTTLQCLHMQLCLHCSSLHCATVQQLQCYGATVQQCYRPVQCSAVCFNSAVLFWPTTTVQQCN